MINFKLIKIIARSHKKPIPKDVVDFMNQERKGIKFGDMDFIHFIRAVQKDAREQHLYMESCQRGDVTIRCDNLLGEIAWHVPRVIKDKPLCYS